MSLEYRSGHWNVVYRPGGRAGRKIRIPLAAAIQDREEAQKRHDEFHAEWKKSISQELNPRPMTGLTVSKLWDEFLPWYQMHRAETTYQDVKRLGKWIKAYLGKFGADDVSLHHINIYKQMRIAEAKSKGSGLNRTINKELAYFSGFLKWAARNGHIAPRLIAVEKLPYQRPLPQVLSVQEIKAILDHAEPFYRAYFLCLYNLGLRSIEVRNLKWDDVDFQSNTVRMIQKGGRIKVLPMGTALMSSLKEIAPQSPTEQSETGKNLVFLNQAKGKAVRYVRRAMKRICMAAKVERHVTPHMLRHSCATHMLDQGINLRIIQNYLGHSQISTTEIYTHVSMANLRAAQSVIEKGFRKVEHRKTAKSKKRDTPQKRKIKLDKD